MFPHFFPTQIRVQKDSSTILRAANFSASTNLNIDPKEIEWFVANEPTEGKLKNFKLFKSFIKNFQDISLWTVSKFDDGNSLILKTVD